MKAAGMKTHRKELWFNLPSRRGFINITREVENVSRADRQLWEAFEEDPEAVAADAEAAYARISGLDAPPMELEFNLPVGPTEVSRLVRTRRVQAFFRSAVLASYEFRCAVSEIEIPELLNASHIIPWNVDVGRRADPRNGIALNALYDRAFDRGLITFDESMRLVLSKRLSKLPIPRLQQQAFQEIEGRKLRMPQRFAPAPASLAYHREHIFA
jgi:hypothetical protein